MEGASLIVGCPLNRHVDGLLIELEQDDLARQQVEVLVLQAIPVRDVERNEKTAQLALERVRIQLVDVGLRVEQAHRISDEDGRHVAGRGTVSGAEEKGVKDERCLGKTGWVRWMESDRGVDAEAD